LKDKFKEIGKNVFLLEYWPHGGSRFKRTYDVTMFSPFLPACDICRISDECV